MWRRQLVSVLALIVSAAALAEEPIELVNPGFEQTEGETVGEPSPDWEQEGAPPGWSVWYGSTARASDAVMTWTANAARSGSRSVSVRSARGPVVIMQQVPVEQGEVYVLRAWGRTNDPASTVRLAARWKKADGSWATSAMQHTELGGRATAGGWHQLELVVQPPQGADFVVVMLTGQDQGPEDVCWLDDVSVARMTGEDLYVGPVSSWIHPMLEPVERQVETAHIAWANPRAGGPLSVLFLLGNDHNIREAQELAQRLEMDYDLAFGHGFSGLLYALNDREVRRKFRDGEYDVVIVATRIGEQLSEPLQRHVARGGGLVLVGWPGMEPALPGLELSDAPEDHYVAEALDAFPEPPEDLETALFESLQVVERAEGGRVASIQWGTRCRCLTPQVSYAQHMRMPHNYWEAFLATLARSVVWAASEEPQTPLTVTADGATVTATGGGADGAPEWTIWSESGLTILENDRSTGLELPAMEAGPAFCAAILRNDEGRVIDFACTLAQSPTETRITSVSLDREWYASGEEALASVAVDARQMEDLRLRASLMDAFGREVWRTEVPVAGDEVELSVPIGEPLTTCHWLVAELRDAERMCDVARAPLLIPMAPWDYFADWRMSTWGSGNAMPPYLDMSFCEQLRATGINSQLVGTGAMLASVAGRVWPVGYGYPLPGTGPFTGEGTVREPCFSDPEVRAEIVQRAGEIATEQRGYGPICAYLRDETSLVRGDQEVCSGPFCAERYTQWLRDRYDSIEALNEAWDTDYASFEEPGFCQYRDVREQDTWAPWVEFRRFMDWHWAESVELIRAGIRQGDPNIPVAYPNTFGPNPFAGRDYWMLAQVSDYSFEYMNEVRGGVDPSGHRYHYDPFRFWADAVPHLPWIGYVFDPEDIEFIPWWASLHGSSGVTIYGSMSTFAGNNSWAMLYPDLRHTRRGAMYAEVTRDLREGVGKLIMSAEPRQPEIALLWSQPSMYVGWMLSDFEGSPGGAGGKPTDPYGSHGFSRAAWMRLITGSGRQYEWLSAEQLPGAIEDFDCLVLPASYALDERTVEAARELLARGGTVIADMGVGITNEFGRPGARADALAELFGVAYANRPAWEQREVTLPGADAPVQVAGATQIEVTGAEVVAAADGEPLIIRKDHEGGGRAYYLNFVATRANEMLAWLEADVLANLPRIAHFGHAPGEPGEYELVALERRPVRLLGVLRERRFELSDGPMTLTLPAEAEVYEVRTGEPLGRTASITADLAPGETALYALLPYRVEGVEIEGPEQAARGRRWVATLSVRTTAPTPGDHVLRVEVREPGGALSEAYTRNVLAERGMAEIAIPFALNDTTGDWRVAAQDIASGQAAAMTITLTPR
ncbi:MAG: beta-galactosidase [Armatimonadota bacterium]|nr:beta-galactosidase [Armatimonadota bacterium]